MAVPVLPLAARVAALERAVAVLWAGALVLRAGEDGTTTFEAALRVREIILRNAPSDRDITRALERISALIADVASDFDSAG